MQLAHYSSRWWTSPCLSTVGRLGVRLLSPMCVFFNTVLFVWGAWSTRFGVQGCICIHDVVLCTTVWGFVFVCTKRSFLVSMHATCDVVLLMSECRDLWTTLCCFLPLFARIVRAAHSAVCRVYLFDGL